MTTSERFAAALNNTIEANRAPMPGIYRSLPPGEYHNVWRAVSNSQLQRLKLSPAHLQAYLKEPVEPTPAMIMGTAVHTAILEPDLFPSAYVAKPDLDMRTKAGKEALACLEAEHPGAVFLSHDDHAACIGIRDAANRSESVKALLHGAGDFELSFAWQHEVLSMSAGALVLCKGRADRVSWAFAGGTVVDVKTCRDARKSLFEKTIFSMGYYNQGAMYVDGIRAQKMAIKHYTIIAIEKEPPYGIAVYRMRDEVLDAGRIENADLLARYAQCVAANEWPCYTDEITDISLPTWAWQTIEEGIQS